MPSRSTGVLIHMLDPIAADFSATVAHQQRVDARLWVGIPFAIRVDHDRSSFVVGHMAPGTSHLYRACASRYDHSQRYFVFFFVVHFRSRGE
jgi:hypothetical protein